MNTDIRRGTVEMSAAMVISGTIGWFVVFSGQPIINVVFWRCLFAVIALFVVCGILGVLKPITRKIFGLAVLGGVAIVLNWVCIFASYADTSISLATIIYNTQPFMLLILGGLFLGERITATKLAWLGISFLGMLLIVFTPSGITSSGNFLKGVALALTAAFFYAIGNRCDHARTPR
jgi:drug/metabolite transporter (DMT)-like permease